MYAIAWSTGMAENAPLFSFMRSLSRLFNERPPTYSITMYELPSAEVTKL